MLFICPSKLPNSASILRFEIDLAEEFIISNIILLASDSFPGVVNTFSICLIPKVSKCSLIKASSVPGIVAFSFKILDNSLFDDSCPLKADSAKSFFQLFKTDALADFNICSCGIMFNCFGVGTPTCLPFFIPRLFTESYTP